MGPIPPNGVQNQGTIHLDEVVIVDYNPLWPAMFAEEAKRVRAALGDLITAVEHMGSTAIPGIAAKPVIDLLIGVRSLSEARKNVPTLEALGYAFWRDDPNPERLFFVKGLPPNGPRTHHLHLVEPSSSFWERLLFRDYLRLHPEEACRYEVLKKTLAQEYSADREAYTEGKTEYVSQVVAKARCERDGMDGEKF